MIPIELASLLAEADALPVRFWLNQAMDGKRIPEPLLVSGTGCEELAKAVVVGLLRGGTDAMVAPHSWWLDGEPPESLPTVTVLVPGLEAADPDLLEAMAKRTALLVAGDAIPILRGASLTLVDLSEDRAHDLWLHDQAGWPSLTR